MKCLFAPAISPDAVTVTGLPFSFRGLADYLEASDFAPHDNGFILPPTRENPTGVFVHGFPFAFALYLAMERAMVPLYGDALNGCDNPVADEYKYQAVRLWKLFGALTTPHPTWPINSLAYRVHLAMSLCPFDAFPRERCAAAAAKIIDKDTPAAAIREHINELDQRLQPDMKRLERMMRMEQDAQSREFIAEHGITLDQVEQSDSVRWWGESAWAFGDWLKSNSKKPWAEWNGRIYRVSDLINKRMPEMPGLMKHLREEGGQ